MNRPQINTIMLRTAELLAERSTCSRLSVGCVIANEGRIISSGYNGPLTGQPPCNHTTNDPCLVAVHAEQNAIMFAARTGIRLKGSWLYTTHSPCNTCAMLIVQSGIIGVTYIHPFRDPTPNKLLNDHKVYTNEY